MFRRPFAWLLAAALPAASPLTADAEIVIDSFVTPQTLELEFGGVGNVAGSVAAAEALGGERDASLTRVLGEDRADLLINPTGDELMSCSAGNSLVSWTVVWDGEDDSPLVDPDGLGGIDLTQGGANDALLIRAGSDLAAFVQVTVTGAAGGTTTAQLDLPGVADLTDYHLPFAAFDTPALLADAGSVSLVLAGPQGLDAQIDDVVATVPEPGGAAMVAACALLVLGRARRSARIPR